MEVGPPIDAEVTVHDARVVGDEDFDRTLRPPTLEDFVNQEQVTEQLAIFIEAAKRRGEPLDHVLLAGPPGLGKTSLAHIVAAEMGAPIVVTAGLIDEMIVPSTKGLPGSMYSATKFAVCAMGEAASARRQPA